jgi:hypothetical protein
VYRLGSYRITQGTLAATADYALTFKGHRQGFSKVIEILGKPSVAPDPGEGALNDPAARQHDEALHVVVPLDPSRSHGTFATAASNLPGVVTAVSPDQFEPREVPTVLVEHQAGPVAILGRGGMDDDPHRQPFTIDQGVNLTTLDFRAGVVTPLVVFTAPFRLI